MAEFNRRERRHDARPLGRIYGSECLHHQGDRGGPVFNSDTIDRARDLRKQGASGRPQGPEAEIAVTQIKRSQLMSAGKKKSRRDERLSCGPICC